MTSNYTPRPWPNEDGQVFHYTDMDGLVGILSESKIRMTNILFLNDWMEGRYIYDDLINDIIGDDESLVGLKDIYDKCLKNTFVASFSRSANLLSQWKYYGNICLVFDRLTIDESRRELNGNPTSGFECCRNCEYFDFSDISVLKDNIKLNTDINKLVNEDIHSVLMFFCFLGSIKHIGYQEENESRLIHFFYKPKQDAIKHIISENKSIPYVEFNIKPESLTSIIIGPSPKQDLTEFSINQVLGTLPQYKQIKIFRSDIPFIPS